MTVNKTMQQICESQKGLIDELSMLSRRMLCLSIHRSYWHHQIEGKSSEMAKQILDGSPLCEKCRAAESAWHSASPNMLPHTNN